MGFCFTKFLKLWFAEGRSSEFYCSEVLVCALQFDPIIKFGLWK